MQDSLSLSLNVKQNVNYVGVYSSRIVGGVERGCLLVRDLRCGGRQVKNQVGDVRYM